MTKITLVRHAAVPLEYQKSHIGHTDIDIDMDLFDYSKLDELKKEVDFDLIYTSDLKRCVNTVKQFSKEFITDKRLREVKFKEHIEGKTFEEIEKNSDYRQDYLENMTTWHSYICDEPLIDFTNRIKEFLDDLPRNKNILVCTHGGAIRMFHSILQEKDFDCFLFKVDYLDGLTYNVNL